MSYYTPGTNYTKCKIWANMYNLLKIHINFTCRMMMRSCHKLTCVTTCKIVIWWHYWNKIRATIILTRNEKWPHELFVKLPLGCLIDECEGMVRFHSVSYKILSLVMNYPCSIGNKMRQWLRDYLEEVCSWRLLFWQYTGNQSFTISYVNLIGENSGTNVENI